jgi:hypothetical protein
MGGNPHFKALKHTAGKHANVPNGDEIGIEHPLKHSQWGPTRTVEGPLYAGPSRIWHGKRFLAKNASKKVGGREDQFLEPRHSHQPLVAF